MSPFSRLPLIHIRLFLSTQGVYFHRNPHMSFRFPMKSPPPMLQPPTHGGLFQLPTFNLEEILTPMSTNTMNPWECISSLANSNIQCHNTLFIWPIMIIKISVHVILGRAHGVFCGIYTCVKRVFIWGGGHFVHGSYLSAPYRYKNLQIPKLYN